MYKSSITLVRIFQRLTDCLIYYYNKHNAFISSVDSLYKFTFGVKIFICAVVSYTKIVLLGQFGGKFYCRVQFSESFTPNEECSSLSEK